MPCTHPSMPMERERTGDKSGASNWIHLLHTFTHIHICFWFLISLWWQRQNKKANEKASAVVLTAGLHLQRLFSFFRSDVSAWNRLKFNPLYEFYSLPLNQKFPAKEQLQSSWNYWLRKSAVSTAQSRLENLITLSPKVQNSTISMFHSRKVGKMYSF